MVLLGEEIGLLHLQDPAHVLYPLVRFAEMGPVGGFEDFAD